MHCEEECLNTTILIEEKTMNDGFAMLWCVTTFNASSLISKCAGSSTQPLKEPLAAVNPIQESNPHCFVKKLKLT